MNINRYMCICCSAAKSCLALCNPRDCSPLLCPWNSPGKNAGVWLPCLPRGDLPDPGMEPRSPALQADSLPSEPPGKPQS